MTVRTLLYIDHHILDGIKFAAKASTAYTEGKAMAYTGRIVNQGGVVQSTLDGTVPFLYYEVDYLTDIGAGTMDPAVFAGVLMEPIAATYPTRSDITLITHGPVRITGQHIIRPGRKVRPGGNANFLEWFVAVDAVEDICGRSVDFFHTALSTGVILLY